MAGAKERISCSVDPGVLARVDAEAAARGESRSAAVERLLGAGLGPRGGTGGVFVELAPAMMERVEAWAERTGSDDVGKMLFEGFLDGVGAGDFMRTETEPASAALIASRMAEPGAPTDGLAALWLDPASAGTMHPSLVYEEVPGASYKSGFLMRHLGMSGTAVSSRMADPSALGYEEVYRERR